MRRDVMSRGSLTRTTTTTVPELCYGLESLYDSVCVSYHVSVHGIPPVFRVPKHYFRHSVAGAHGRTPFCIPLAPRWSLVM